MPCCFLSGYFTISWSLQSRQPLTLTSSGSLSFFISVRSNGAPLPACSSVTWVWMFSSMLSRNLQGCALPSADIGVVTFCCEDQSQRMEGCERPHPLPDQTPSPWRCLIPWAGAAPLLHLSLHSSLPCSLAGVGGTVPGG